MERLRKVLVVALLVIGVVMALAFNYMVTDNYTTNPGKKLTIKLQVFPFGDPSNYTLVIGDKTYTFTKDGKFILTCIPENTTINVKVYQGDVQTLVWEGDILVNRSKTVTVTVRKLRRYDSRYCRLLYSGTCLCRRNRHSREDSETQ